MGWTAGDDTLTQVELTFPSAEAAVAYARRQGMGFVLHGSQASETSGRPIADSKGFNSPPYQPSAGRPRLERVERALGSDVVCQGAQPGGHHAKPQEVLRDPSLSLAEKRDVLRRWALDAYLIELSLSKGEAASEQREIT
jgi:hypothetical protein